jgi:hypothetical protein
MSKQAREAGICSVLLAELFEPGGSSEDVILGLVLYASVGLTLTGRKGVTEEMRYNQSSFRWTPRRRTEQIDARMSS